MTDDLDDVVELMLALTTARAPARGSRDSTSQAEDAIPDENNILGKRAGLMPTSAVQEGQAVTEVGAEVAQSPNELSG